MPPPSPTLAPAGRRRRLQVRQDIGAAKARLAESEKRIDSGLDEYVAKQYW